MGNEPPARPSSSRSNRRRPPSADDDDTAGNYTDDEDDVVLRPAPSGSSKRTNGGGGAENGTSRRKSGSKSGAPAAGVEGAISSFFFDLCQTPLGAFVGEEEGGEGTSGGRLSQKKSPRDSDAWEDYSDADDGYGASRRHRDRERRRYDDDESTVESARVHATANNKAPRDEASVASTLASQGESSLPRTAEAHAGPLSPRPDPRAVPLASSFAKRCHFTKAGIGKSAQHYEGLSLHGSTVLMLAGAMKLKGCPTICDEDLRRVEGMYPNQFGRLPDELLLSSGWRRISKYCHFSNKAVPDGVPFFHSKQREHPSGGYYFLLAAAVGMARPLDVEPLCRDHLVLLETDYPAACEPAPPLLLSDPTRWCLVDRFCFFSGGPINPEEDVYYEADFDGNAIYMLAFLSPSLTAEELYQLGPTDTPTIPTNDNLPPHHGLDTRAAVAEVERVYDLTPRDFDDLKLYHLGPCRALPPYLLKPEAWRKVLSPAFVTARAQAMERAARQEGTNPTNTSTSTLPAPTYVELQNNSDHGAPRAPYGQYGPYGAPTYGASLAAPRPPTGPDHYAPRGAPGGAVPPTYHAGGPYARPQLPRGPHPLPGPGTPRSRAELPYPNDTTSEAGSSFLDPEAAPMVDQSHLSHNPPPPIDTGLGVGESGGMEFANGGGPVEPSVPPHHTQQQQQLRKNLESPVAGRRPDGAFGAPHPDISFGAPPPGSPFHGAPYAPDPNHTPRNNNTSRDHNTSRHSTHSTHFADDDGGVSPALSPGDASHPYPQSPGDEISPVVSCVSSPADASPPPPAAFHDPPAPPRPASPAPSETRSSAATRGANELLRRHRQMRAPPDPAPYRAATPDPPGGVSASLRPRAPPDAPLPPGSAAGGSSVTTGTFATNTTLDAAPTLPTGRRALILQMAKARMKREDHGAQQRRQVTVAPRRSVPEVAMEPEEEEEEEVDLGGDLD